MSVIENQSIEPQVALEALLFVSSEPVTLSHLATVLGLPLTEIESGLNILDNTLQARGLRIQRYEGRVQLTTAPEMADLIERFMGLEVISRLSRAAIETLAIVAYQQPITRPYIDGVRGVTSDGVIKSLLGKNMIQELGRADGPGRPILYGTTIDFLQYFGINSLSELPPINLPDPHVDNDPDNMLKS